MRRAMVGVALALVLAPVLAVAEDDGPFVFGGQEFATLADYFASDYFREIGGRCGLDAHRNEWDRNAAGRGGPARADCSAFQTNPAEVYDPDELLVVDVVVHVLESVGGDGAISDEMIHSQIDVLNEDFLALEGSLGEPGTYSGIRFRLAETNPQGEPEVGITRSVNEFWFNDQLDPLLGWYYDNLAWDPHRYLNIYTLSPTAPGGLILGYVPFLPADNNGAWVGGNDDRVCILWKSFGRNSPNARYDLGRTTTHEVGHYFGLEHVFTGGCGGGNCYTSGDLICDTEPDSDSHGGCPTGATSCSTPDPIHNYMEYTDDICMWEFTPEQVRRIRCTTDYYRPNIGQVIVSVGDLASRGFSLHQNRPNPFNPTTHIAFELEQDGFASVAILDVGGRVLETLSSGALEAGRHDVTWDGTDADGNPVGSGVYFYRLTANDAEETRRMVLLK